MDFKSQTDIAFMNNHRQDLKKKIDDQVNRIKKAEQDRRNLLSQSVNLSTLVLVMLLPIIAGAYLGHWLDEMMEGYSMRWTISLLVIGIVIGMFNVYFLIKD
jgi:ATP synthase protein I